MKIEHLACVAVGFLVGCVTRTLAWHLVYLGLAAVSAAVGYYVGQGGGW